MMGGNESSGRRARGPRGRASRSADTSNSPYGDRDRRWRDGFLAQTVIGSVLVHRDAWPAVSDFSGETMPAPFAGAWATLRRMCDAGDGFIDVADYAEALLAEKVIPLPGVIDDWMLHATRDHGVLRACVRHFEEVAR